MNSRKKKRMKANPQFGEQFMKAVVKASLTALLAIGIRSQQYIDQFIIEFTNELDKSFADMGLVPPQEIKTDTTQYPLGVGEEKREVVQSPAPGVPKVIEGGEPAPETTNAQVVNVDSSHLPLVRNLALEPRIRELLITNKLNTIDELQLEMAKRSLTEIGLTESDQQTVRDALTLWNSE